MMDNTHTCGQNGHGCGPHRDLKHECGNNRRHRGASSFYMQDSPLIFERLHIRAGDTFLDLGCGAGDYSVYAAKLVGPEGAVYALDRIAVMPETVCSEAASRGLQNIHPVVSDICRHIDMADNSTDICFIATVLHSIDFSAGKTVLGPELRRILKPGGRLAVVECKKERHGFGPPMDNRISPEELEQGFSVYGFRQTDYEDLGTNYFSLFVTDTKELT